MDFPRTEALLEEYRNAAYALYRDKLQKSGRVATRELIDHVMTSVRTRGGMQWQVVMELPEYWKYVEDDTLPHWSPKGCLVRWIQAKPIIPRPQQVPGRRKPVLPTVQQLDYLIRRKIADEGTKGSHDLAKTVAELNEQYIPRLRDAMAQDFGASIFAVIKEFKGNG